MPSSEKLPHPLPNCLILGRTAHVRIHPRRHGFSYPLLHLGVDLDDLISSRVTQQSSGIIGYNQYRPLAIWDRDYLILDDGRQSIRAKLDQILLQQANIQASLLVGRVFMVTGPRLLNYAFNPLTIYYCYRKGSATQLLAVVLDVSNTFGERHIYICDPAHNATALPEPNPRQYTHAFTVARAFHVSPFNTRRGVYHAYTKVPDESQTIDLQLIMEVPKTGNAPLTKSMQRILSANIQSQSWVALEDITHVTVSMHVLKYLGVIFLTMPRILYQAFQLSYNHKLWVYDRPPILRACDLKEVPLQLSMGHARTIRALPQSRLASHVRTILCKDPRASWAHAAHSLNIPLVVFDTDPYSSPVRLGPNPVNDDDAVKVFISENQAWEAMALMEDPVQGIIYSYVKGELSTTSLSKLIQIAEHAAQSPRPTLSFAYTPVGWTRRFIRLIMNDVPRLVPAEHKFLAPIEAHGFPRGNDSVYVRIEMAVLIMITLLIQGVMKRSFVHMAKFAWSTLNFDARLRVYVEGRGTVPIPAESDMCDEQAISFAREMRDQESVRWAQVQAHYSMQSK